jgi:hypothetical protein
MLNDSHFSNQIAFFRFVSVYLPIIKTSFALKVTVQGNKTETWSLKLSRNSGA